MLLIFNLILRLIVKRIAVFLLLLYPAGARPQDPANDIDFLIRQIEKNYPGYRLKVNPREYQALIRRIKSYKTIDTLRLLSELTLYFNDKHLVVYDLAAAKNIDSATCRKNLQEVYQYFNDPAKKIQPYEGYWRNDYNNCIMAIKKTADKPLQLKGYVITSRSNTIPGTVICEMEKTFNNRFLTGFTDIDFGYRMFIQASFIHSSLLQLSAYARWEKMPAYRPDMPDSLAPFDYKASLKILDSNHILLRIPENSQANTKLMDSLVQANKTVIAKTKNLIIDLRNNIGGTVRTYYPLLPYIHTGPIIRGSDSLYCSEEFIQYFTNFLQRKRKEGDTGNIARQEKKLQAAIANKGRSIFFPGDTIRFDSVSAYPAHVAIITNYASLSAAELMVLDCKQSNKVTTFGETTGGAVDYLDFFPLYTPSKKYVLYMPSVKRVLAAGQPLLDASGIAPDIKISDKVPDWVGYVKSYYEKHP